MKRRNFVGSLGVISAAAATTGLASCSGSFGLKEGEILHTVNFDLIHPVGSADAVKFLKDGKSILTKIKGVKDFQVFRQSSAKNDYQYSFFMRFESQATYDSYNAHPDHVKFVQQRWDVEVSRFQESDFVTYF